MVKIPESYGRVINLKNITKDTINKIKKIESIIEYLQKQESSKQHLFLQDYKINFSVCNGNYDEINIKDSIYKASDDSIENLYNYIFCQKNIIDFFEDKDECLEVFNKENFFDLKILLDECFNCIQSGNKLATVIMIRSCIEKWLTDMEITEKNNEKKINDFINQIETDSKYNILQSQSSNIEKLLHLCRENGNHVAHSRIKEAQEYIKNYCLETSLKLLCKLIEITILKKDIMVIKNKNQAEKIKNMQFSNKKLGTEQNNNKNFVDNADDEIFF